MTYARGLGFDETPNYAYLRGLLRQLSSKPATSNMKALAGTLKEPTVSVVDVKANSGTSSTSKARQPRKAQSIYYDADMLDFLGGMKQKISLLLYKAVRAKRIPKLKRGLPTMKPSSSRAPDEPAVLREMLERFGDKIHEVGFEMLSKGVLRDGFMAELEDLVREAELALVRGTEGGEQTV